MNTFDITLTDELEWSTTPKPSHDDEAAQYTRQFLDKWTEKGGIPPPGPYDPKDEGEEDDDMGAVFTTTDRQLANANHDIGRLVDNARLIVSDMPNAPDIVVGHKMVLLDRARRVAFGDARPAPMSLTQGLDGGVNRTLCRHRRPRPEDYADASATTKPANTRRADMLPRRRAETGTKCVGVLPNRFTVTRHTTGTHRPRLRVIKKQSEINSAAALRRNRTHNIQRVLAGHLFRDTAART